MEGTAGSGQTGVTVQRAAALLRPAGGIALGCRLVSLALLVLVGIRLHE